MRKYTKSHEWVELDGPVATIGITKQAKEEIGEIVYIELPEVGKKVSSSSLAVVLESTKAAIDITSPVSGVVLEANSDIAKINRAPEGEGWLFRLTMENRDELKDLLDQEGYFNLLGNGTHDCGCH